jgi:hypothetical protein
MKVLIACEFSGIVREAFRRRGHNAWSCDFESSEIKGQHFIDCVQNKLRMEWDLMIAHPPCTYLSAAGLHYCKGNPERQQSRDAALFFVKQLFEAPIAKIAIENPVGYLSTAWRKPDQTVRMNWFGHAEAIKPTCLWLKGLPPLVPTNEVEPRRRGKRESEWYSKTKNKKDRSRTFAGFAEAMATQWG